MKITITKNINSKSKVAEIEFTFTKPADEPGLQLHHISRSLTGTTNETDIGIFVLHGQRINFDYGNFSASFTFTPIDPSMTIAEITKHLKSRILEVKTWVESIKIEEEAKVASLEVDLGSDFDNRTMRKTFPQVAGIYKCLREDFHYVAILTTDGHRQTWLDDALPCDKNGKALKGYQIGIPFEADEIGDFINGLDE